MFFPPMTNMFIIAYREKLLDKKLEYSIMHGGKKFGFENKGEDNIN